MIERPIWYERTEAARPARARARSRDEVDTVECKWDPGSFDVTALDVFRGFYPRGRDYLVTPSGEPGRTQRFGSREVRVCTPSEVA